MANSFIPPKETEYCGVKYRSRLEARWAVFLSQLPGVKAEYEKITYNYAGMQTYTPDFIVECNVGAFKHQFLLEVKPAKPTQDYRLALSVLADAAKHDKNNLRRQLFRFLYYGCGDFYPPNRPIMLEAFKDKEYSLETMFVEAVGVKKTDFEAAVHAASGWRFDV